MVDKINWGVLSSADTARTRWIPPLLRYTNNARLYAVSSRSTVGLKLLEPFGAEKSYLSYDELLADPKVDAVFIPLPNTLHLEWAIKAMEAKKHVLCEKPLAMSPAEIELMEKASTDNGVLLTEAFACMHTPLYSTLRNIIQDGKIGEIRVLNSTFAYMDQGSYRLDRSLGGGAVYDVGCYTVLTIRQLSGREPIMVKNIVEKNESGCDLSCFTLMDMGDGVRGVSRVALNTANRRGTSVWGTKGTLSFDRTPNAYGKTPIALSDASGTHIYTMFNKNSYALEIEQFGRCITHGERPVMTLEESKKNMRALEMILRDIQY